MTNHSRRLNWSNQPEYHAMTGKPPGWRGSGNIAPITRGLTNRLRTLNLGWIRLHSRVICPIPFQSWQSRTPSYFHCLDTLWFDWSFYSLTEWQSCVTFVTPKKRCSVVGSSKPHASILSTSAVFPQNKRNNKSSDSEFIWHPQNTWPFARETPRGVHEVRRARVCHDYRNNYLLFLLSKFD